VIFTSERQLGPPALHYMAGPKSGPVLLFLHGLGRFSEDYRVLAAEMAQTWRSVVLDFRGHGDSAKGQDGYLVTDYLADTLEFIQAKFSEPIIIYGHSLGAMVALAAAAKLPAHVRGVILEDPPFHTMGRRIQETPWAALFVGMQEVSRRGGSVEQMSEALGNIRIGLKWLRDLRSPEALAFGAQCLSKVDPAVFNAPIRGRWLDGYDEREFFKATRCPILLLQGDPAAGAALTDEDAEMAEKINPLCQRLRFEGAGHLVRAERSAEVFKAMTVFLAELPPLSASPSPIPFHRAAEAACTDDQPIRNQPNQSNRPYV
jgi:pimeloyl-ACP methyl ester carboxylesterase